jgi:serine/threonine-protein kinase RsbW
VEKRFPRELSSLDRIFTFLDLAARFLRLPEEAVPSLFLVAEELFTNMVKYQSAGTAEIAFALERSDETITLRVTDPDSERFDVALAPDPDLSLPIEDRRPGGLGVYLTKKIMDEVRYDYHDRTSTITLTKRLRRSDA